MRSKSDPHSCSTRSVPSVFLDTSVLKASIDSRFVFQIENQKIEWGAHTVDIKVSKPVLLNPNVRFREQGNEDRFQDTIALRYIAALTREGKIRLVCHNEVRFELFRLPKVGGAPFYGVPIDWVDGPFKYGRVIADGSKRDHQYEFLIKLEIPRFQELQRACGAYQGTGKPPNRSQLLDAFHLLCAEHAEAQYFLTIDDALIRAISNHRSTSLRTLPVTPMRLVSALVQKHPTWLMSVLRECWRIRRSGRQLGRRTQDAMDRFWGRYPGDGQH